VNDGKRAKRLQGLVFSLADGFTHPPYVTSLTVDLMNYGGSVLMVFYKELFSRSFYGQ